MEQIAIQYSITNEKIKVESDSTIFVSIVRGKTIDIANLDKDIKEIRKICKERKIIFSQKNGLYKFFKDKNNQSKYLEEKNKVNKLFDKLMQGWQEKVQKGIYPGYGNDEEINKLCDLERQIVELNKTEVISTITSLFNTIKDYKKDLNDTNYVFERIVI